MDLKVVAIKKEYGLIQTKAELHARDFCISINEQDDIADFASLGWNERRAAVEELRKQNLAGYASGAREEAPVVPSDAAVHTSDEGGAERSLRARARRCR